MKSCSRVAKKKESIQNNGVKATAYAAAGGTKRPGIGMLFFPLPHFSSVCSLLSIVFFLFGKILDLLVILAQYNVFVLIYMQLETLSGSMLRRM